MKKYKVSFDFDGTLELKPIQAYARELMQRDWVEVWVTTTRWGDDEKYKKFYHTTTNVDLTNNDLREVTNELGIPETRIHFTNMENKWPYIKSHGDFVWHIDDCWVENRQILNNCAPTKAISAFGNPNWKAKCERILRNAMKKDIEAELRAKYKGTD